LRFYPPETPARAHDRYHCPALYLVWIQFHSRSWPKNRPQYRYQCSVPLLLSAVLCFYLLTSNLSSSFFCADTKIYFFICLLANSTRNKKDRHEALTGGSVIQIPLAAPG